ncbi:hypothetical protein LQ938_09340 [Microbacterium sp. cx-55]|uniref:hypothetical protein n=1 Tax=Microbacterium sp. cx-55 TaxID=2875948 RepID=UPI001CBF1EEA|nr:hypothetical protein [Microbacterium sp. cx-55]MBZ4486035.1 hypothetical protein [Microbacterium sp. cx-55]UGB34093.1 hypothetical protein LQ938_09340 [Microbacterium sp. cx-55]
MTRRLHLAPLAALVAASGLLLAGCVGGDTAAPAVTTAAPVQTTAPAPVASATTTPTAAATAVTCENLIPTSIQDEFASHNWTYKQDVFRVGERTISDGISCVWGDYSVASDHVQIFAWAPISGSDADAAQTELLAAGWLRVDDPNGTYLTEDPQTAVSTDEDGYGLTYEFGDGWVTMADTKQSLVLIDPPA